VADPVLLEDALEAILDAMVAAISEGVAPEQPLAEVESVVRGDRARPMPKLPAIWVVPEPATTDNTSPGLAGAGPCPSASRRS
jgi:hypothetical protein